MLNAEFLTILKPFYYLNTIFFVRKYTVTNHSVRENHKATLIGVLLANVFVLTLFCVTMAITTFGLQSTVFIYYISYFQYVINYGMVAILNHYLSASNVQLVQRLQKIYEDLYRPEDARSLKILSRVACAFLLCVYGVLVSLKMLLDSDWNWARGVFILTTSMFDLEIIQVSFLIYFLACKMKVWIEIVEKFEDEILAEEINISLRDILRTWNYIRKSYQLIILLHFVTTFVQSLVYIEILIIWSKKYKVHINKIISHTLGVLIWISKGLLFETALCASCDNFYRLVERARVEIISKVCNDDLATKKAAATLLRILNTYFSRMTACAVFRVDGYLPLKFFGVVATYTVVLLQFAFL